MLQCIAGTNLSARRAPSVAMHCRDHSVFPLWTRCVVCNVCRWCILSGTNDTRWVLLFGLRSSCFWVTVTSPKEAAAASLPKHVLFGWWGSPVNILPSLGSYDMVCTIFFYYGTVNNCKDTWHVLMHTYVECTILQHCFENMYNDLWISFERVKGHHTVCGQHGYGLSNSL